ncbi:hypothetical protein P7C70_g880, partial [Phenoliferia sp. Uapishka_3]
MGKSDAIVLQDQTNRLHGSKLLVVFFGLQLALFLSFLDSTSVSTAIPDIGRDLNASASITWVGTSFLVANTSFQIVTSRLSDIFGRKIVLLGALALFVLGDLLCGFAKNAIWLYCCRAVAGIGGGGINSLCMIIMSDVVSLRDRGKYQGLLGIAISLGSGFGPFMGGLFAEKVTWRWTFWVTPPCGVITMIIIWFLLPLSHVEGDLLGKVKQMDWLGTLLSLAMTVCALVPLSGGGTTFKWTSSVVIGLFTTAGVCAIAFVLVQAYFAKLPLLPMRLFKNFNICIILIQTWLVGMVYYGNIFYFPLYAQNVLGMGAIKSAAVLLPLVLGQTFTTTISGFWVKRTGHTKSSFVLGFAMWFAGQAAQLCFKRTTSIGVLVGVLLIQGLGAGATLQSSKAKFVGVVLIHCSSFVPSALVLAQASGTSADRAVVTGARNFARTSGGAIGLAVSNTIVNNLFAKNLPSIVPPALKAQLAQEFELPSGISTEVKNAILDAYMVGIKDVFIYLVPVTGLCLVLSLILKDISLNDPEPIVKENMPLDEEAGGTAEKDISGASKATLELSRRELAVEVVAKLRKDEERSAHRDYSLSFLTYSFHWSTLQERSTHNLETYRPFDAIAPLFSGIIAFLVQTVFAYRSYILFQRVLSKYIFLVVIGSGILVATGGAFLDATLSFMSAQGTLDRVKPLSFQTSSAIWLWVSAFSKLVQGLRLTIRFSSTGKRICSLFTTLSSRDRIANQLSGSGNHQAYTIDGVTGGGASKTKGTNRTTGVHVHLATQIAVDLGSGEEAVEMDEKAVTRSFQSEHQMQTGDFANNQAMMEAV